MLTLQLRHVAVAMCLCLLSMVGCESAESPQARPATPGETIASPGLESPPASPSPDVSTPPPTGPSPRPSLPEFELPPPPALADPGGATLEERAAALADAVTGGWPDRLAAWLAVYDALGVPVITEDGRALGTTGDDPIGAPYWRVWYAAALGGAGNRVDLADVATAFATQAERPFDGQRAAQALFADLSAAAVSADPDLRLFGTFMANLAGPGSGAVEPDDPQAGPAELSVPAPAAELLLWLTVRSGVAQMAREEVAARPLIASTRGGTPVRWAPPPALPTREKCSEAAGGEEMTTWVLFIVNKLGAGLELKDGIGRTVVKVPGFAEMIAQQLGWTTKGIERAGAVAGWAGTIAGALTFLFQFFALKLEGDVEPWPLPRTRDSQRDNERAELQLELVSDPGSAPDGDRVWACLTSFALNMFGIDLKAPPRGPLPAGVGVTVSPGRGFSHTCPLCPRDPNAYVTFDHDNRRLSVAPAGSRGRYYFETDPDGRVGVPLIGTRQRRDLKDALPWLREASVHVYAQPEPVSGMSLLNVFLGGFLTPLGGGGQSATGGVIDILKTMYKSLGEKHFLVRDWAAYVLRIELIGLLDIGDQFGSLGTLARDGLAEIPLNADQGGRVTGSGPMVVGFGISLSAEGMQCEGNGEDRLTVSIDGTAGDELLLLKTDWSGTISASGQLECVIDGQRVRQPFPSFPLGNPDRSSSLVSGFEMPIRDNETETFDFPASSEGNTTIIVTLIRVGD